MLCCALSLPLQLLYREWLQLPPSLMTVKEAVLLIQRLAYVQDRCAGPVSFTPTICVFLLSLLVHAGLPAGLCVKLLACMLAGVPACLCACVLTWLLAGCWLAGWLANTWP